MPTKVKKTNRVRGACPSHIGQVTKPTPLGHIFFNKVAYLIGNVLGSTLYEEHIMSFFKRLAALTLVVVSVSDCTIANTYKNKNYHPVDVGPRPQFLVDGLEDSPLKKTAKSLRKQEIL